MTAAERFRSQFPIFDRVSFLNAGSEGPVPRPAAEAVTTRVEHELIHGRGDHAHFMEVLELAEVARARYAAVIGADPAEVALTGSTTDGVNTVVSALDLRPGDEILTSDEEHPGLLAPLGKAHHHKNVEIRVVPFDELVGEVTPKTRLVACSHVSWVSGRIADVPALAATGVPVLLDAAQSIGAIPVDVRELGCDFYAASGQKWLCGPEGSGCLYVRPERLEDLQIPWPSFGSIERGSDPLDLNPAETARRLDHGFPSGVRSTWTLAALDVLEQPGLPWVQDRAATLAAKLAELLTARGLSVLPRGASTLVSWKVPDAEAEVERLAAEGIVVRHIPVRSLVRASVGAWNSEEDLDRLTGLV